MLSDFITEEMIHLQVTATDWREAILASGDVLVQAGVCEPRYVQAMVKAVETMGPYMVLSPGIALAHARPDDGVVKIGMAILTLAEAVNFGSPENDPVSLVIAFGGVDKQSHIQMLQELAMFISDETNQQILKTATDVKTVMLALSKKTGG